VSSGYAPPQLWILGSRLSNGREPNWGSVSEVSMSVVANVDLLFQLFVNWTVPDVNGIKLYHEIYSAAEPLVRRIDDHQRDARDDPGKAR
jgi:hypothetical protein